MASPARSIGCYLLSREVATPARYMESGNSYQPERRKLNLGTVDYEVGVSNSGPVQILPPFLWHGVQCFFAKGTLSST